MAIKTSHQTILANAKVNLSLAINGQNSYGYHNLLSLTIPVSLYDEITISEAKEDAITSNLNSLGDNIISKVVSFAQNYMDKKFHIQLEKKIPVMSGFGGGNSDAVAILKFFNKKYKLKFNPTKLQEISKPFGSDCPFFVQNKPSTVKGIGEIISPFDEKFCNNLKKYSVIVFKPNFAVSTALAYKKLREYYKHLYLSDYESEKMLNALASGIHNFDEKLPLFNTFSNIVFAKHRELYDLKSKIEKLGASMMLSGSGSGCFCIFKDAAIGDKINATIRSFFMENIFIQKVKII